MAPAAGEGIVCLCPYGSLDFVPVWFCEHQCCRYGQTGPKAREPGYASVCEAFGGFRHINGYTDRPPVRPNISLGDTLAGLHGAFGTVMALLHKQRCGVEGQEGRRHFGSSRASGVIEWRQWLVHWVAVCICVTPFQKHITSSPGLNSAICCASHHGCLWLGTSCTSYCCAAAIIRCAGNAARAGAGGAAVGLGQVVDASISESVFNMLEACAAEVAQAGHDRQPSESTISGVWQMHRYVLHPWPSILCCAYHVFVLCCQ